MSSKDIASLTDVELRNELKSFDQNVGPITKTTRKILEKKLLKLRSLPTSSVRTTKDAKPDNKSVSSRRKSTGRIPNKTAVSTKKLGIFSSDDDEEKLSQEVSNKSHVVERRKSRRRTMPANVTIKFNGEPEESLPQNNIRDTDIAKNAEKDLSVQNSRYTAVRNKTINHDKNQYGEFSDEDLFPRKQANSKASNYKDNKVTETNNSYFSSTPARNNVNLKSTSASNSIAFSTTKVPLNSNSDKSFRNEIDASLLQIRNSFSSKKPSPPRKTLIKNISPKKISKIHYDDDTEEDDVDDDNDDEEELDVEFASSSKISFSSLVKNLLSFFLLVSFLLLLVYIGLNISIESRKQLPRLSHQEGGTNSVNMEDIGRYLDCLYIKLSRTAGDADCGFIEDKNVSIRSLKDYSLHCIEEKDPKTIIDVAISYAKRTEDLKEFFEFGNDTISSKVTSRSLYCRLQQALSLIVFRAAVLIAVVVFGIGMYFYIKHRWTSDDEQARMVIYFVDKIIDTLKQHHTVCMNNKEIPPYLPIPHVRDMLIPVAKRKKMAKTWQRAVEFLNSSESRIRVETQRIAGEDFDVWRWIGVCTPNFKSEKKSTDRRNAHLVSEQSKCWQGPAFDDIEKVVRMPIVTPTPCLKIRYMHEGPDEKDNDWVTQTEDAILEKCEKDGARILHIGVDKMSKEGCVYVKCESLDSAGKAFRSIYGNWFDGRLAIVKFVTLARYHQRFPEALDLDEPLKPSGTSPSSLSWVKENPVSL